MRLRWLKPTNWSNSTEGHIRPRRMTIQTRSNLFPTLRTQISPPWKEALSKHPVYRLPDSTPSSSNCFLEIFISPSTAHRLPRTLDDSDDETKVPHRHNTTPVAVVDVLASGSEDDIIAPTPHASRRLRSLSGR